MGIVEEQHPDRTRLFMQWHNMSWPVMVDSLNLLEVSAVPITLLIDEQGFIRAVQPTDDQLERFLQTPVRNVESREQPQPDRDRSRLTELERALREGQPGADAELADGLFLWGRDEEALDRAIAIYDQALARNPENGTVLFRRGVAFRKRYEQQGSARDFRSAVESWRSALAINPNQYIWRRRIQQYGPRLDKPYSFYDWVHEAREVIRARGSQPVTLPVEPGGAEFAYPLEEAAALSPAPKNPDAQGRIIRDLEGLVKAETVMVPHTSKGERVVRVHVEFRPNLERSAHWNNEAGDMLLWVDPPADWAVEPRLVRFAVPLRPVSQETRVLEFELGAPPAFTGEVRVSAYALYYVCEDVNGTCLFRRKDIPITVEVP